MFFRKRGRVLKIGKIDRGKLNTADILFSAVINVDRNVPLLTDEQQMIFNMIKANLDEKLLLDINLDSELSMTGIDSITFIKIVVALEEKFEFEFEDEKLLIGAFPTIKSIIDYVVSSANFHLAVWDSPEP